MNIGVFSYRSWGRPLPRGSAFTPTPFGFKVMVMSTENKPKKKITWLDYLNYIIIRINSLPKSNVIILNRNEKQHRRELICDSKIILFAPTATRTKANFFA